MLISCVLLLLVNSTEALDLAEQALQDFRAEDALQYLQQAHAQGPYDYTDHQRLYALSGVAHAYLDHKEQARAAFARLLDLAPGYAVSYTLSPKVTFLFHEVRQQRANAVQPELQLNLPHDLGVDDPIAIDIAVLADPRGWMQRASVYARRRGEPNYQELNVELARAGAYTSIPLPAPAEAATGPEVIDLYLIVSDADGNQVLLVGSPERPRAINLSYTAPVPWYTHWWLWASLGGAAALGVGATVFALTYQPADSIGGSFSLLPSP